jgi:MFS family permease
MFMVGVLPALLVLYIRTKVEESPVWLDREHKGQQIFETIIQRWPLFVYMIVLMTAFNFFSHGTEDLYPTFLQVQRKFPQPTVAAIAIIYNIGAILGALCFGTFSERIGRRKAICIAAPLALPIVPLWAFSSSPFWLAVGAFVMQHTREELRLSLATSKPKNLAVAASSLRWLPRSTVGSWISNVLRPNQRENETTLFENRPITSALDQINANSHFSFGLGSVWSSVDADSQHAAFCEQEVFP